MSGITSRRGRVAATTAALALCVAPLSLAGGAQAAPGATGSDAVATDVAKAADKAKNKRKKRRVDLQLLSFNDFHGHLDANDSPQSPLPSDTPVGGAEYLAAHIKALRASQPKRTLTVAAGDLIGGSPLLSGLFQDQPSIESMNRMGLDVSSVGNHEFDEGTRELRRMVRGGCHADGCFKDLAGRDIPYEGADFKYLAANVVKRKNGKPFLPATSVREVKGVKVGFIGMTLEGTDALVSPSGVANVEFLDEVRTANREAKALKRRGVKAIVVLLHEGGYQTGGYPDYQGCDGVSGPVVDIAERLHPEIDHVITGHTHQPYVCKIPDRKGHKRLVTSAASYGQVITETHLKLNRHNGQVARRKTTSTNRLVTRDVAPDRPQTRLIYFWKALSDTVAGRVIGTLAPATDITGDSGTCRCEETPMADLVADAILWGTQDAGAEIAFMNTGGVRASLLYDNITDGEQPGEITYREAYSVAPFNNILVSVEMTGAEIEALLNQQFQRISDRGSRPMLSLGVSEGFTYEWAWEGDTPAPNTQPGPGTTGGHVVPGSMELNGVPIEAAQTYRVATLNFLADGGDSFTVFGEGENRVGGPEDLANLVSFLEAHPAVTPPADRVAGL